MFDAVDQAELALCPGRLSDDGSRSMDVEAFFDLHPEIGLRLLRRLIDWHGNEGPAELGQVEKLHEEIAEAGAGRRRRFRRTLAGAMVTLSGSKITVERAPPRRSSAKSRQTKGVKAPFTKPR